MIEYFMYVLLIQAEKYVATTEAETGEKNNCPYVDLSSYFAQHEIYSLFPYSLFHLRTLIKDFKFLHCLQTKETQAHCLQICHFNGENMHAQSHGGVKFPRYQDIRVLITLTLELWRKGINVVSHMVSSCSLLCQLGLHIIAHLISLDQPFLHFQMHGGVGVRGGRPKSQGKPGSAI